MDELHKTLMSDNIQKFQIENKEEFKDIFKHILCNVCLDIPLVPMECSLCEGIICEECNEILNIAEKKCVSNKCKGGAKKANKFMRDSLSKMKLTCLYCGKTGVDYTNYQKHLYESCEGYKLVDHKRTKCLKEVKEKSNVVDQLQEKINQLKLSNTMNILSKSPNSKHEKLNKEAVRSMFLTFELPTSKKMELYNAAVQGDISSFKHLVLNQKYPLFEEISANSHYWTAIHYAMHYGQSAIVYFIFEIVLQTGQLDSALQLTSADGRCPLLCLLRSNYLDSEKKKSLFTKLLQKFKFYVSSSVRKELRVRNMEDLIQQNLIR